MRGLGTIINALAIVIGGVLGILFKRFLKERYQDTIIKATGFSVVFLGAAGTLSKILTVRPDGTLSTGGSMVMILSLALGALLGELIDLDAQFERFGEWLKHKTGSDGDNQFVNGFVSASLTVSIGAMAVIGSIQDGIYGDHSTLVAKAILDFIIVLIMASSMGKGCVFSFIPVAVLQGAMTALAVVLSGFMTDAVLNNLSLVGNILIFCVGINLFLLASNMSEVLGVFFATLLGFTLLNPVHLLFINLITDCFPALALGLEKGEPDTMTRPPRDSKDGIFAGGLGFDIVYQGLLITLITLASYIIGHCMEVGYFEMPKGVSDDGMTMAFLTMSMCEIFHSFNMRSQRKSVFSLPSHNKVLWGAMVGSLVLTTLVLEVPVIANAFGFTPVSWTEYGVALALAFLVLPVVELVKLIQRRAARRKAAK